MRTYPKLDESSRRTVAFEIENAYLRPTTVVQILAQVAGVAELRQRRPFSKWEHIHVWFKYQGAECVVWEPFGDNSRYWIGQRNSSVPIDITAVEEAFKSYEPPLHRRLLGSLLTLRLRSKRSRRSGVSQPPP
jgi:hypothetical protein